MSLLPTDRPLLHVTYYNLPNTAWDIRSGLHVIDFGLDPDLDGQAWTISWYGPDHRAWALNVMPGSLDGSFQGATETVDASAIAPWADLVGYAIERVERINSCVIRLHGNRSAPVIVATGWHAPELDLTGIFGPSVLVVLDPEIARQLGKTSESDCR